MNTKIDFHPRIEAIIFNVKSNLLDYIKSHIPLLILSWSIVTLIFIAVILFG